MNHLHKRHVVQVFRRAGLLLVALATAAAVQSVSPSAAFSQQPSDLDALQVDADTVGLPTTATRAQASTMQNGVRSWGGVLTNHSNLPVTNPTISIGSGYDASLFTPDPLNSGSITAFPVVRTQPSLPSGQSFGPLGLNSTVPVSFPLGYDSARTVDPVLIPPGGALQTVTVTMTSRTAALSLIIIIIIIVGSTMPGVSVVSVTDPNNLTHNETNETIDHGGNLGLFQRQLHEPQLDTSYTFSAVLNVPNSLNVPIEFRPEVLIESGQFTTVCDPCAGSTTTVRVPTLDGSVPGSGNFTFSVAETTHTWVSTHADNFGVRYAETPPPASPDGGSIAFVSTASGWTHIYAMNPDGTNQHPLTSGRAFGGTPTFSPDGTHIAFSSSRTGNGDIYIIDANGNNLHRLTTSPAIELNPSWG